MLRSTLDFAARRSWLLLPAVAAGAGAGYALDGFSPVMAGGAALGLAPALGAGLALESRGHRLRTQEDVERWVDIESLGAIGRFEQSPGSALPTEEYPEALQAYRELAAGLRRHGGQELRVLLVTSAGPEEGKSTTAANLATILAELGSKVVLVDGDLRWSSLRSTNANASSLGLSGLLLNYLQTPQLAVVRTTEPRLSLLPAGLLPKNPHELLALPRLGDIFASLREMADYVVVDSPPVLEADDARLLARNVDATLLVMHAGRTRSRQVNKALRVLTNADARPMGAVLNAMKLPKPARVPAVAPATPKPETASYTAPAPPVSPALDPHTVAAFRKGPPRPVSANVPRDQEQEIQPAVMRLAKEGFENSLPPAPVSSSFERQEEQEQDTTPRLRVLQPDERPLAPAVNDWEPMQRARPALVSDTPPSAMEQSVPASQGSAAMHAPLESSSAPTEGDASVDDVLAHMQETLRLIREMRQERSPTNS